MEAVQCARMFSHVRIGFVAFLIPCGVYAFVDLLDAAAVDYASGDAFMFSACSGRHQYSAARDISCPYRFLGFVCTSQLWIVLFGVSPFAFLFGCKGITSQPCFGLPCPSPSFWNFWLDNHLLWQVAPLLSTQSGVWRPTVVTVGSRVVWWLGWFPVGVLFSASFPSLLCLVALLPWSASNPFICKAGTRGITLV